VRNRAGPKQWPRAAEPGPEHPGAAARYQPHWKLRGQLLIGAYLPKC